MGHKDSNIYSFLQYFLPFVTILWQMYHTVQYLVMHHSAFRDV